MDDLVRENRDSSKIFREQWLADRYDKILRFFKRRLINHCDAHDLAQETVLKILRYFNDYDIQVDKGGYCIAFVYRNAHNVLRDFLRKCTVRKVGKHVVWDEESDTQKSYFLKTSVANPLQDIEMLCTYRQLLSRLDSLNGRTRNVFVLSRVTGLKSQAIADLENISVSSVEKHLHKARSALREVLHDH